MDTPIFNVGDILVDKASEDKAVISEVFKPGDYPPNMQKWNRHPDMTGYRYSFVLTCGRTYEWMTEKYVTLTFRKIA